MSFFKELKCDHERSAGSGLHHAYVIPERGSEAVSDLVKFCAEVLGVTTEGNPDFFSRSYDLFGIDESRTLRQMASQKSVTRDGKRIFILVFEKTTHEAQNALLKLFEEPNPDTHFFLIVSSISTLLPTLRSRVQVLTGGDQREVSARARHFLSGTIKERNDLLVGIIKEKDQAAARVLCDDLEAALHAHAHKTHSLETLSPALKAVSVARDYLADRSPSVKMILEYLIVTVPKIE